jgi:hypothetical protein
MRRTIAAALLLASIVVPAAAGDGGPGVAETAGLGGTLTPTGFRYVVVDAPETSVLTRIGPSSRIVAMKWLPGRFAIPAVAYDQTPVGLSADGKTLVLIQPRSKYPRERTRFLVLSSPGMFVRHDVVLQGDFVVDAISPDGSLIYFIEYLSRRDPSRYAVRAFAVEDERLLPDPIVDRSEPNEVMRGSPISRASSPDGRWAYTLYDGGGGTPFIHALDTVAMEAHCIDLEALAGRDDYPFLRLRRDDGTLTVVAEDRPLVAVDTASFDVSEPGSSIGGGREIPWAGVLAGVLALLAAGAVSLVALRRRLATR